MSDPIILTIITIIVLLALSGFFSGSETALTGASRPRMHQLASEGNRRAKTVSLLHAQQERLIGGICGLVYVASCRARDAGDHRAVCWTEVV